MGRTGTVRRGANENGTFPSELPPNRRTFPAAPHEEALCTLRTPTDARGRDKAD
ncbi:hypothetical protein GCM10009864_63220 [Streptomyces lunalinharesii]|uniref:Uncharacterized protein n=1 Tax=Streptomyces lunalinharesii TaxID=333384 RepID=A0ABN3SP52_9ACTN